MLSYKLIFFILLISVCQSDCPFTRYPEQTVIGHIQAYIGKDPQLHDNPLKYQFPFSQSITISQTEELIRDKNCAIAINGLETLRSSQYQEVRFNIQPQKPYYQKYWNQIKVTGISFKITVSSTLQQTKNYQRYNWNYLRFSFIYSHHPQISAGYVQNPRLLPLTTSYQYRVQQSITKRENQISFNAKKIIPKIFLTGVDIEELKYEEGSYAFDIEGTIKQLEQLRKFSWSPELIQMFKKNLLDHTIPSLMLNELKAYELSLGHKSQFKFSFNVDFTSSIKILHFSYSYLFYIERQELRGYNNIFQYASGSFLGYNTKTHTYQGIQHTGFLLIGIKGYRTSYSYSNLRTNQQFSLSVEFGNITSSSNLQNSLFFHIKAQNQNSEFSLNYFGIQKIPSQVCTSCISSRYNLLDQYCVSTCPTNFIPSIDKNGAPFCQFCDAQKYQISNPYSRTCQCAENYYRSPATKLCEKCPPGCLRCSGSQCITCDHNKILNPQTSQCYCNPVGYYQQNHQSCYPCHQTCKTCYGPSFNECLSCGQGRVYSRQRTCTCAVNFKMGPSGNCQCLPPYRLNRFQCQIVNYNCGSLQVYKLNGNNYTCQCINGFFRHQLTNQCIHECQEGQTYSYNQQKCKCLPFYGYNPVTKKCVNCSLYSNQRYNQQTESCECQNMYHLINPITNQCTICPYKQYLNLKTGQCQCNNNYYRIHGKCQRCIDGSIAPQCHTNTQNNNFFINNGTNHSIYKKAYAYNSRHNDAYEQLL